MLLTLGAVLEPCGARVVVQDISSTGLSFESSTPLDPGDVIEVRLPELVPVKATVVRRMGPLLACRFQAPIPKAALSAALLRSDPRAITGPASTAGPVDDRYTASVQHASPNSRWGARALAAAALAGVGYLLIAGSWTALGILAAALVVIGILLVLWGNWVIDNV